MTITPNKVLVLGAGGHARVVANLVELSSNYDLIGVLDDKPDNIGEKINTSGIIGAYNDLKPWLKKGITHVALALGDNSKREKLHKHANHHGFEAISLIHPTAIVDADVKIGPGAIICAGAIVATKVNIGCGAIVNTGAIIDHESKIGDYTHVAPGCKIAGRVTIECHSFIGIGSTIIQGITIGSQTIVGAGSVVLKDASPNSLIYGAPAVKKK